ncbi:MAG: cell envelope integrity protein TolA [Gammaproteobacteria bacterium]|nr:cell envelope integrity protein TolA [Gammaproteobacteria bacterium]MDG2337208.1 cell envelope integrity protein TolA [Gammaproteobacteria bacterium]
MKDTFNNVVIYNGYPLSLVVAVTFHSAILALLLFLQSSRSADVMELVQPTVVKALLVQENPQVANERVRLKRQQQQQQRAREQEQAQQAAEAERQRQEQARAEEQRKARELASLRQRQEKERLDAEQLQREQETLAEEQRRQRELVEAQRQQEVRDRETQREREAAEAAAAEIASSEFEMVQSGTALIQQLVQESWSRPPSARNGMRAVLQMRLLPTGELVDVSVTQSSGDPAFDRSAENAVYGAAPFRELQALPINIFNENFRSLSLIFEPEDLLN